ncbi:MAG: glycosyltransferase family 39 protein [Ruminococcus sp.]|nr:glycosyltransferase family 39 protein [Ruminococcus sp.]MCM1381244.1 glycosyltransferase family 39 protein [Muribaculaceae bacterium]MCM1479812.1 glycosyltransferase family 39 protein [Muribaculaceae bacterium]
MEKIKTHLKANYIFAVLLVCACVFSVIHIIPPFSEDIINYDSAYQYFLTVKSPAEIARLIPEDYSPPLYTVILKLWTLLFGESLFAMRAASLIVIWGMLFLAAFPIRTAFGNKVSVLCTAFFSFTSINYMLVPEIRPTFFAYFFVTAACVYCYLAYIKESRYAYVCFTVFSVCAMYTHNIGMLAALAFYISALAVTAAGKDRKKFKNFFISGTVCAVCYVPWLTVVFKQFGNVKKNYWSNDGNGLYEFFYKSFLSNYNDFGNGYAVLFMRIAVPVCACVFIVIGVSKMNIKNAKKFSDIDCLNFKKYSEKYLKILLCVLMYFLPFVLWTLFSLLLHPIMAVRYYYIFSGTSMLFFAVLTERLGKKAGVIALTAVSAVSFAVCTVNLKNSLDNSEFLDMVKYIETENPDGDIAFLHTHEWTLGIMMYYFPNASHYIADDTWCVLNTYDVFPAEVLNIGEFENIADYEKTFYIFGGAFPDANYFLSYILLNSGKFNEVSCYECSEPYTYQKGWELINVESQEIY